MSLTLQADDRRVDTVDMRFGSTARVAVPAAVALIGVLTQQWFWAAVGGVGLVAVVGLRIWAARTTQPDDGLGAVVAVFLSIAVVFLAGAVYLWLAVGGASAAIIGALAMGIALLSAYVAYAAVYTKVTGKKAPGAVRVNAIAGYLSRDVRLRP